MDEPESLVARRPRRSTAGNRMEAVLAEVALQPPDPSEDLEEGDVDFVLKDEEDQFGSDFASTDEEADAEQQAQAAEAAVVEEERTARKEARERTERATRAAAARQRVTFDPKAHAAALRRGDDNSPPKRRPGRKKSAEALTTAKGKVSEDTGKRKSSRKATVASSKETKQRLKEQEKRQAALVKRPKQVVREMTQDEYIARALEMEEGNILEHRNYLATEEEKRRRAKVVRQSIQGPLVRLVSRIEDEVPTPMTITDNDSALKGRLNAFGGSVQPSLPKLGPGKSQYGFEYTGWSTVSSHLPNRSVPPVASTSTVTNTGAPAFVVPPPSTSYPVWPPPVDEETPPAPVSASASSVPPPEHVPDLPMSPMQLESPTIVPEAAIPTRRVTKNYVVHELDQQEGTKKPNWKQTMRALFGDHVRWEDLKVYTGRNRPYSRPVETCPLTGLPAKYKDPRTGVAFADMQAYQTLTSVLRHEFVWSETLGCYVDRRQSAAEEVS